MPTRVLVSTSSFIDTPGAHRTRLSEMRYDVVEAGGPLSQRALLDILQSNEQFDGYLCGEDEFSTEVIQAISPRARVISKYGVALDRIDLEEARRRNIIVAGTPRVNHTTVAELTFGLLIGLIRRIPEHNLLVQSCQWKRHTGVELAGKTIGILGFGRVGKEVVKRALCFGMNVLVYNTNWSNAHSSFLADINRLFGSPLINEYETKAEYAGSLDDVLARSDFVSFHMNLSKENRRFFDRSKIALCKPGVFVVNVSRGELVHQEDLAEAVRRGHIAGYAADVVDPQPIIADNPLLGLDGVILTPHIGSRTYESVERQGLAALDNLIRALSDQSWEQQQAVGQ